MQEILRAHAESLKMTARSSKGWIHGRPEQVSMRPFSRDVFHTVLRF